MIVPVYTPEGVFSGGYRVNPTLDEFPNVMIFAGSQEVVMFPSPIVLLPDVRSDQEIPSLPGSAPPSPAQPLTVTTSIRITIVAATIFVWRMLNITLNETPLIKEKEAEKIKMQEYYLPLRFAFVWFVLCLHL